MRSAFVCIAACVLAFACSEPSRPVVTGDPAPPADITTTTGRAIAFPGDFAGKIVILNFWLESCGSCRTEMPALDNLRDTYGDDLAVIGINVGRDEKAAAAFVVEHGIDFPVAFDFDSALQRRYNVVVIPTTFIVAPDGTLAKKIIGEAEAAYLDESVSDILSERQ